jgi:hypothetical protein
VSLELATDEEAISSVDALKTGQAMELWKGEQAHQGVPVDPQRGKVERAPMSLLL